MSRASGIVVTTMVGENLASLPVLSAAIDMNNSGFVITPHYPAAGIYFVNS